MHLRNFTKWYVYVVMLLWVMAASCQKDASDNNIAQKEIALNADSALSVESPDNFLATEGTLTIKLQDSTYTFDAAHDSVAFVNMSVGDDHYFGITAINKEHTMSFGISSKGAAAANLQKLVAGGQLLMQSDAIHTQQYTLTQYAKPGDAGNISLQKYHQQDTLAVGSFFTFLSKDDDAGSPFYRVEGTFKLKAKK